MAFVQADNDCAYRRALLRRSRPKATNFEPGDWVLYWRRHKGGTRGERGRWYGPGQVLSGDSKVVYVSHCGQLIRAAPEQLRSASLREWQAISNVSQGVAQPRQLVDLVAQGNLPDRMEVESEGPPPVAKPPRRHLSFPMSFQWSLLIFQRLKRMRMMRYCSGILNVFLFTLKRVRFGKSRSMRRTLSHIICRPQSRLCIMSCWQLKTGKNV